MGKMKPAKRATAHRPGGATANNNTTSSSNNKTPLAEEIESLKLAKPTKSSTGNNNMSHPYNNNRAGSKMEEEEGDRVVDSRITARILSEARRQHTELQDELDDENNNEMEESSSTGRFKKFQTNFIEQQKIRRKSNSNESSDSDTDNEAAAYRQQTSGSGVSGQQNKEYYSDEEVFKPFLTMIFINVQVNKKILS